MLNLGMTEIFLFAIIAVIVLGPEKLPEAVRFAGRWYGKIKRMISNVQQDIDRELRLGELREQMQQELQRIKELEEKMQSQLAHMETHDFLNPKNQSQPSDLPKSKYKIANSNLLKAPYIQDDRQIVRSTIELKKAV